MIDHTGIPVADFGRSRSFYDKAFAPLGASLLMVVPVEHTGGVRVGGYGRERPVFWLHEVDAAGSVGTMRFRRGTARKSMPSTKRRWRPAGATMASRD